MQITNNIVTDKSFYVYVYLDPRKEGNFKYAEYNFSFEPFYIGKGQNNRFLDHMKNSKRNKSNLSPKNAKINKLKSLNINPLIIKIMYFDDENDAYEHEKYLIEQIGSNYIPDIKDGPLCNMIHDARPPNHGGKTYLEIYGSEERVKEEKEKRWKSMMKSGQWVLCGRKHSQKHNDKIRDSINNNINARGCGFRKGFKDSKEIKEKKSKGIRNSYRSNLRLFILQNPKGEIIETVKLEYFCKINNISRECLYRAFSNKRDIVIGKTAGWKILEIKQLIKSEWDKFKEEQSLP